MKIYVAAPVPLVETARTVAKCLILRNHLVVSTWHKEGRTIGYDGNAERLGLDCVSDQTELESADALVAIMEPGSSGGMYGELAIALSRHMKVFCVGEHLSIWSYHPDIVWLRDLTDLVASFDPRTRNPFSSFRRER